jgi:hypothetical protein
MPSTGNVQALPNPNSGGGLCVNTPSGNVYVSNPAFTYNASKNGPQCTLVIKAQF